MTKSLHSTAQHSTAQMRCTKAGQMCQGRAAVLALLEKARNDEIRDAHVSASDE